MKFNYTHILLNLGVVLLLSSCFIRDKSSPEPEDIFLKVFGGIGTETTSDLGISADSDLYYILGTSTSNPINLVPGLSDLYLIQTDVGGNKLKEIYLNISNNDDTEEIASSMKVLEDEIIVIGQTRTINSLGVFDNRNIFYSFTDLNLNITRTDSIGVFSAFGIVDEDIVGNDIIRTSDGNYVVLATIGDPGNQNRDIAFMKITNDGNILWTRRIDLPDDDAGVSVIEFPNGNLGICGETSRRSVNGRGGQNVLYIVTSEIGLLKNSLAFGSIVADNDLINDIPTKMINDGNGAIIIGNSDVTAQITSRFSFSVSQNGRVGDLPELLNINEELESGFTSVIFNDVARATNGELIFTGRGVSANDGTNTGLQDQVLVGRANQASQILFLLNNFGDDNSESGEGIIQLPDGDVLIAATIGFGNNNNKIGLFKLNGDGQLMK